ncbi:unnamed protein product [Natator depressus]
MSQAGTSPWLRGSSSRQRGIAMELYAIPLARGAGRAAVQTEPEHFLSEGEAPVLPAFKVQGQRKRERSRSSARGSCAAAARDSRSRRRRLERSGAAAAGPAPGWGRRGGGGGEAGEPGRNIIGTGGLWQLYPGGRGFSEPSLLHGPLELAPGNNHYNLNQQGDPVTDIP